MYSMISLGSSCAIELEQNGIHNRDATTPIKKNVGKDDWSFDREFEEHMIYSCSKNFKFDVTYVLGYKPTATQFDR